MDVEAWSDDAWSAATLFKANPHMVMTFHTPGRLHPRLRTAFDELIKAGVFAETADAEGLHFSVASKTKLKHIPSMSYKDMKRVALPTTID